METQTPKPQKSSDDEFPYLPAHRRLASFLTAVQFGLGLYLSSLTIPSRIIWFLVTPFHRNFDPTLVFLALGALPVATVSYFYGRGGEKPRLGGKWTIPKGGEIDRRLLVGAAIFGIGWGIEGLCRTSNSPSQPFCEPAVEHFPPCIAGPVLVNLGITGIQRNPTFWALASWLASFVLGGTLVEKISP